LAVAAISALGAPGVAQSQAAPVELVVRGMPGTGFSYAATVEIDTQVDFGPIRQRDQATLQSRIDVRVVSVDADGVLTVRIAERDRRVVGTGAHLDAPAQDAVARVRPDGRIIEIREGEHASASLLGVPLPGRPVRDGDTWDQHDELEVESVRVSIQERSTLRAVTRTADGAVARFTSTIQGAVVDFQPPELPEGVTMRVLGSSLSGAAAYDWHVDRGQPLRAAGEIAFEIRVAFETPDEVVPGAIRVRVVSALEPVSPRSGDARGGIRPGAATSPWRRARILTM
jgi:hypothetical protein